MTRLFEAAKQLEQEKEVQKSIMASSDLGISKALAQRWISSDVFYHMKVAVDKLPLLAGELIAGAEAPKHSVIVDLNKNKINQSATYTPKVTVICGADIVRAAKKKGITTIDCWIGAKAAKALKLKATGLGQLGYNPSPNGPALGSFNLPTTMKNTSPFFPDFVDYGPAGSELNNPQFMSMLNIEEALSMYLSNLKNGIWKPVSSQWATIPPSLVNATKEASIIVKEKKLAASFAPIDFVLWQETQLKAPVKHKYDGNIKLSASKFAFVGDTDDPSTWLFRADSLDAIKASASQLKDCKYLSKQTKMAIIAELKKRSGL